ncbi:hypothetical protein K1728_05555 [Weissella confusa]|uniref:hypothetical protein n=1 Tax=Weissella confusa TaxID=1583 RepID=UPI001C6FB7F1|nr:hypothetical protein [Weissella confusa]QYU58865.1 hypothetical protein K1728_05555 [Weissella confusa]
MSEFKKGAGIILILALIPIIFSTVLFHVNPNLLDKVKTVVLGYMIVLNLAGVINTIRKYTVFNEGSQLNWYNSFETIFMIDLFKGVLSTFLSSGLLLVGMSLVGGFSINEIHFPLVGDFLTNRDSALASIANQFANLGQQGIGLLFMALSAFLLPTDLMISSFSRSDYFGSFFRSAAVLVTYVLVTATIMFIA